MFENPHTEVDGFVSAMLSDDSPSMQYVRRKFRATLSEINLNKGGILKMGSICTGMGTAEIVCSAALADGLEFPVGSLMTKSRFLFDRSLKLK